MLDLLRDTRGALAYANPHWSEEQIDYFIELSIAGEECKHLDHHFDRSLCACGAMHYLCDNCGAQLDECQ